MIATVNIIFAATKQKSGTIDVSEFYTGKLFSVFPDDLFTCQNII